MEQIAIVNHIYGAEVTSSAEVYCKALSEQLLSCGRYQVDVLTTCANDDSIWSNFYKPGREWINGVCVNRFQVKQKRDCNVCDQIKDILRSEHTYENELLWLREHGPYCPEIFEYIHGNYSQYRAIIFMNYLYYTTTMCMLGIPNALFFPMVSADDPVLHLKHFRYVFHQHRGYIFSSKAEKELIEKIYGLADLPYEICDVEDKLNIEWGTVISKIDKMITFVPDLRGKSGSFYKKEYELHHEVEPAFDKNNIAVVFAADDGYTPILCVAIQDVLEKSDLNYNYDIVILSDGISLEHRRTISQIASSRKNICIRYLEMNYLLDQYTFQLSGAEISRATFMRMLLPDVMRTYDKVLYLDGDTVVKKDINELYNIELKEYLVAAVRDPYVSAVRRIRTNVSDYLQKIIGIELNEDYFNAGILLMNLKAFRLSFSAENLLKLAAERKWLWDDQCVLNKICKKRVYWLSQNWNVLWTHEEYVQEMMLTDESYYKAVYDPFIIHYAGATMPVKQLSDRYMQEFWEIARKTPFYEYLIRQYSVLQLKEKKDELMRINHIIEEQIKILNQRADSVDRWILLRLYKYFKRKISKNDE